MKRLTETTCAYRPCHTSLPLRRLAMLLLLLPFLGRGHDAHAQAASAQAWHYIRVTEDVIKPGEASTYAHLQQEKAKAWKAAHWGRVSLALTHAFGPQAKVFHYSFYRSFREMEEDDAASSRNSALSRSLSQIAAQEDAVLSSRNVSLIVYNPDISYQGDFDWAAMRWMSLIDIQLKAGVQDVYRKNRAMTLQANQIGQLKKNLAIYTNVCGMQSWQYLIMRPERELADFDELSAMKSNVYSGPYGAEIHTRLIGYFRDSVRSEREDYLRFDPTLSYTTAEWAGTHANFWQP